MREAFGASPDLTRLGRSTVERIEYFEHPNRNNAPGATMPRTAPEPVPRADSLTPVTQALVPAVLIIDEINRGNLPKLLGGLLYALEYRNEEVRLPFEWEGRCDLVVPKDLYIVGTMNSSDRSIGHIDVAVRRRFGLLHIEPDAQIVRNCWQDSDPALGNQLANLMVRLNQALKREDPGGELLVGDAYFLADGYRALFVEKRAIPHSLERTDERPW
jgi:hypothetical protein